MVEWIEQAVAHGAAALAAMDKLLRDKPQKNDHDFSDAVCRLVLLRDDFIARQRAEDLSEHRKQLGQINGILTALIAGNYPLGRVPWKHIEKAREALAVLTRELA